MGELKKYWSEDQIVELLGAVCLYGFLNRWNDSMATDLERLRASSASGCWRAAAGPGNGTAEKAE